jgi:hypothetical protein
VAGSSDELDRLEQKIERLRREYDLYLTGNRRTEPTTLKADLEREVVRLTRFPFSSTAVRFRLKSLAHRFRAVETQARNLIEQRNRALAAAERAAGGELFVVVDRAALDDPAVVEGHLRRLHRAVVGERGGKPGRELDSFRRRLLSEARSRIDKVGAIGIRYSLVVTDGDARLRGELLRGEPGEGESRVPGGSEVPGGGRRRQGTNKK